MRILKFILTIIIFVLLTILTQVGGIVYLLSFLLFKSVNRKFNNKLVRGSLKFISFLALYSIATFLVVPVLTKLAGRVPLPILQTDNLKPLNFLTCFLNRHYVRLELKQATVEVAQQMTDKFPGTVINYLDANFPFIDNFPLVPHLSHSDGKKLDIAFCYIDNKTQEETNKVPSAIGYGISEEPRPNEENMPAGCAEKGYWQYSLMTKIISQKNKEKFTFDSVRTKELVTQFASKPVIGKIFIEPHLKTRLKLNSKKIRFHGCQAVRHDDHIHVQLK